MSDPLERDGDRMFTHSDPLDTAGDRMFTAAAEYGRTYWGWDKDPEPEVDPVDDLLERAENANSPELALAYAQMATARAIQAQTEQARIGNLVAYATHRADHSDAGGPAHVAPALRNYLYKVDAHIREGLGIS